MAAREISQSVVERKMDRLAEGQLDGTSQMERRTGLETKEQADRWTVKTVSGQVDIYSEIKTGQQ